MMALVLVLSLSVSAFAAPGTDGSITITNATVGETYSLYKIFEATYGTDSVTYTIATGDEFFDDLFGDGTAPNDYFEYHASTGVVTRKTGKTDAELFGYLANLVKTAAPVASDDAEATTLTFSNLTHGYYVISRTNGTTNGVTITNAKPGVEVHDKNHLPGDLDKTSDKTSAKVGDTISWTLKLTASNYDDGDKIENYTIWDILNPTGWAAIDLSSIKVYVAGAEISEWTLVSDPTDTNGFKIDVPWVNTDGSFKYGSVVELMVTYSATVKDAAAANDPAAVQNKNVADLEWDTVTTPDVPGTGDETDTEVYNLGFTKVDGTDPTKTLPGAVFGLYSDAACTTPVNVKTTGTEGVYMVDPTSTTNSVVTPANGQVVIQGLAEGIYYLKETTAPDGYNLLADAQAVEVGKGGADELVVNGTTYVVSNAELNIANNSGVELPSTGGKGTMMLITFGSIVAMAFAVLMITQKKMSIYND